MRRWFAEAGLVLCLVVGAQAQVPTSENTVITSKTLSFDYKRMVAVFDGDVVVVDPEMRMESARLNVIFEGTNQIKTVTATGNVRILQADKTATCDRAIYTAEAGTVMMSGNAVLTRGANRVMGETITFWMHEDRMSVESGSRLIIEPQDRSPSGGGLGLKVKPTGKAPTSKAPAGKAPAATLP